MLRIQGVFDRREELALLEADVVLEEVAEACSSSVVARERLQRLGSLSSTLGESGDPYPPPPTLALMPLPASNSLRR